MAREFRSSQDGSVWVFTAAGSLDPNNPNPGPHTVQVYRWEIGDPTPTCLSCNPVDGQTRFRGASLSQGETVFTETVRKPAGATSSTRRAAISQASHAISDDASVIGFDSPDRLLPEDKNDVRDVYLWDANANPLSRHVRNKRPGRIPPPVGPFH